MMEVLHIDLSSQYSFLADGGSDAELIAYLQQDVYDSSYVDVTPRPALVICPGGGFLFCSLREAEPVALSFMPLRFNCFVLRYSVMPHKWPLALQEMAAAIDLIYRNAKEWNIDTDKIVLSGFSAGGYLAASYCTRRNLEEITSVIEPKPVRAALLGYPVITAREDFRARGGSIQHLLGVKKLTSEHVEKFSLERHVSRELTPPSFIWHTAADDMVPVENSLLYARALAQHQVPFELHVFPEGGHGIATGDCQTVRDADLPVHVHVSQWVSLAQAWLKQMLDIK